jgi:hypothetical protein
MRTHLRVYLSSSWKNRERVRYLADAIRAQGHEVYDFTDPGCREGIPEIPPEKFPEPFDPKKDLYRNYINSQPPWRQAVMRNKQALNNCDVAVLMLPCGQDAHADAYYALGLGRILAVVGQPKEGERTPTHLWADAILDHDNEVPTWLNSISRSKELWHDHNV